MAHAGNAAAGPAAPTDAREEAAAPVDEIVAGAGAETPGPSDGNAAETKDDSTNEKRGTGELEKRGVAEIHAPEGAVEAGAVAAAVTEPAVAEICRRRACRRRACRRRACCRLCHVMRARNT